MIAASHSADARDLRAELRLALEAGIVPRSLRIVHRAKQVFGEHYGIHVDAGFRGQFVIELQKGVGVRVISFEEFARGRPVIEGAVAEDVSAASARALQLLARGWRYDLLQRNCEHAAQWVVLGRHSSGQVSAALLTGLLMGLVWALGGADAV